MTNVTDRIQQLQAELLAGDRRLQQCIEGLGDRTDLIGEQLAMMAKIQGQHQQQLGQVFTISDELYRLQAANQKEIRDLLAGIRRNREC